MQQKFTDARIFFFAHMSSITQYSIKEFLLEIMNVVAMDEILYAGGDQRYCSDLMKFLKICTDDQNEARKVKKLIISTLPFYVPLLTPQPLQVPHLQLKWY